MARHRRVVWGMLGVCFDVEVSVMQLSPPVEAVPPSKAPEVIAGMFNRIARTYDLLNDCMTGGMHRLWKRQACALLRLSPGDRVLDLCTGTGDLASRLARQVGPQGEVVGLDFSEEMLARARERFGETPAIQWVQGDAMALPFEDNHFDGAVISFGLRNVASVPQVLAEMARVVKPGGWVVNLDTASDCKNPLFWLYFSHLMPLLGRLLAQDEQAYAYLCRSTQTFASPEVLRQHLADLGLTPTRCIRLGFGSVAIQCGQKPLHS